MANIRIDLEAAVINGQTLTFKSPADCSDITGLIIYYQEGNTTKSKTFHFVDAHGVDVGSGTIRLFGADALVRVILDTDHNKAYVQNADTNAYLEEQFSKKVDGIEDTTYPGCYYRMVDGEKEWLNPPMVLNTAYRTTERYNGKPVWVGLNDYGSVKNMGYGYGIAFINVDEESFNYFAELVDVHPYLSDGWMTTPYYHPEDIGGTEEPPYFLTEDGGGFTQINFAHAKYVGSVYESLNFYCRFKFTYEPEGI